MFFGKHIDKYLYEEYNIKHRRCSMYVMQDLTHVHGMEEENERKASSYRISVSGFACL